MARIHRRSCVDERVGTTAPSPSRIDGLRLQNLALEDSTSKARWVERRHAQRRVQRPLNFELTRCDISHVSHLFPCFRTFSLAFLAFPLNFVIFSSFF